MNIIICYRPVVLKSDGTYDSFTWNDDYQFDSLGRTGMKYIYFKNHIIYNINIFLIYCVFVYLIGWTNANSFDRTVGTDTTKFHGKFGDGNIQSFKRFFTPLGSGVCVAKYRLHWSDFIENEGIARDYIKIVSSAGATEVVTLQQRGTQPGGDASHPTWKASNSASGSITMSVIKDEEFSIDFQTQVTQPGWPNLESTWISDISINCILTDEITCPYATINNITYEEGTGITNNRLEITCAGVDIGIQTLACADRTLFIRNGWDLVTIDCDTYFRACHNLVVYTGSSTTIKCSNLEQCGNMQLFCGYTPYNVALTALQITDESNPNFDPSCDEDSIAEFVANNGYLFNVNAQCQFVADQERTPNIYCPEPSDSDATSVPQCDVCNNQNPPSRCQFVPTCTQCDGLPPTTPLAKTASPTESPTPNTNREPTASPTIPGIRPFCNACINNAEDTFALGRRPDPSCVFGRTKANACNQTEREYCCNDCPTKNGQCDTTPPKFGESCNPEVCVAITAQIDAVNTQQDSAHKRKRSKIIDGFITHYTPGITNYIYYDWHSIAIITITICIFLIIIIYFIKEIIMKNGNKNVNKSQKESNQNE